MFGQVVIASLVMFSVCIWFSVAFVSFHFSMRRRRGPSVLFTEYRNYYYCSHSLDGFFFLACFIERNFIVK